jgi:hypothetical protein
METQAEITVWLHGTGSPIDVTRRRSMACAGPFTVRIAFDEKDTLAERVLGRLSPKFCERDGQRRVLGKITLNGKRSKDTLPTSSQLVLFEARRSVDPALAAL